VRGSDLTDAIADFASMIEPASLATADPLGIGGLLVDAYRLSQLVQAGTRGADPVLLEALLAAALQGLRHFSELSDLAAPANRRLAFRELGLALGLAAVGSIDREALPGGVRTFCAHLDRYVHLRRDVEAFWSRPEHRKVRSWIDHADINDVMLATSLAPEGFLIRPSLDRARGRVTDERGDRV
jgi:hypothetical protein